MKKLPISFIILLVTFLGFSQTNTIDQKVTELLDKMTLEEKIGQLNQYTNDANLTGPLVVNPNKEKEINNEIINAADDLMVMKSTLYVNK